MEVNFNDVKKKDVINLNDGAHLGRVCNMTFTAPEYDVLGFTVTGCKGFRFSKQELFIPVKNVVKIGQDTVLVKWGKEEPPCPPAKKGECPPKKGGEHCPPPCPPPHCPPPCPPKERRSFDEYE